MRIILTLCLLLIAQASYAQAVNVKWDRAYSNIQFFDQESTDRWNGVELEAGFEFKKPKLFLISGFTFGYRHELDYAYGGHYVFSRIYRVVPIKKIDLSFSGAVVYGLLSANRYKTVSINRDNQENHYYLYPNRGYDVPIDPVRSLGTIYSEFTFGIRSKALKIVRIEPLVGVRILRYGATESNLLTSHHKSFIEPVPIVGIRIGTPF